MRSVTYHAKARIKERANPLYNKNIVSRIRKQGITLLKYKHIFGYTPLVKYLRHKLNGTNKKIYLYNGYVFIFDKQYANIITTYAIPDRFLKEYNEFATTVKNFLAEKGYRYPNFDIIFRDKKREKVGK